MTIYIKGKYIQVNQKSKENILNNLTITDKITLKNKGYINIFDSDIKDFITLYNFE